MDFIKIKFYGSMSSNRGGVRFVIQGPDSRLLMVGGSHMVDVSIPGAEL